MAIFHDISTDITTAFPSGTSASRFCIVRHGLLHRLQLIWLLSCEIPRAPVENSQLSRVKFDMFESPMVSIIAMTCHDLKFHFKKRMM